MKAKFGLPPPTQAPTRSRRGRAAGAGAEYGLAHCWVGIGAGADERYARRLHRFAELPEGVFVWTRDRAGGYRLGRITGPVRDDHSVAAQAVGFATFLARWTGSRGLRRVQVPNGGGEDVRRGGATSSARTTGQPSAGRPRCWSAERASPAAGW